MGHHIRQLSTWVSILTIGGLLTGWAVGVGAQQTTLSDSERLAKFLEEKGLLSAQDVATLDHRVEATHEQWVTHWSATRVPPPRALTNKQLAKFLEEKGLLSAQDLGTLNHRMEATDKQWVTHWSATRVPPSRTLTSKQLAEFLKEKGLLSAQDLAAFEHS
jgi:predicted RNA-binding protein